MQKEANKNGRQANQDKQDKTQAIAQGQRTHTRRLKQERRKTGTTSS